MKNEKLIDPLTEIFIITGTTLFLICYLYRKLPIDLIPDCIPCIGQYDNMFAGFCSFIGLIICLCGIYIQYNYSTSSNTTIALLTKSKNYMQNAQEFIKNDDNQKWDDIVINTQYFLQRGYEILKQSFSFISNQINEQMKKNEL